ncbi:MAG TPA: pyruvate kinase, partial [Gemmatimonadetes bacterium]|nr:pyruvate kinase [Gemmatimonadota bacterium]
MVQGGMNLAHLNMSHGEREGHGAAVGFVRDAAIQLGWLVGIMVDLSGPTIPRIIGGARVTVTPTFTLRTRSRLTR